MNVELHQLDLRYEKLRTRKPEAERKLVGSLAEIGQQVPVVVVHGEGPERFVLVDGDKRVRALRRLGQDLVGATCWDLSEAEALVLDRLMRTGEGATALEQGWLFPAGRDMGQAGLCAHVLGLSRRFPIVVYHNGCAANGSHERSEGRKRRGQGTERVEQGSVRSSGAAGRYAGTPRASRDFGVEENEAGCPSLSVTTGRPPAGNLGEELDTGDTDR